MITKLEIGWFKELPDSEDIMDYGEFLELIPDITKQPDQLELMDDYEDKFAF